MNEILNTLITGFRHELPAILENLHFIRVDWFFAFIPLCIYLWLSHNSTLNNKNWHAVIDAQLLPFVLNQTKSKKRRYPLLLIFIAASLCITALAGPVYKKLPQPVYREQSSLVVLLDLSQSMNASDIKSSRLSRAKFKLLDLLQTRKTGQTALIVYAADAFVVTPLTDDNSTIANLVPSLSTDMMPAQGSNLSAALAKAFSLLTQAGAVDGDILVITDDIHQRDEAAIKKVSSQGHRLSIYGIGTTDGAPIPLEETQGGGFLLDSNGAIVIPKLRSNVLRSYALQGGGLYTSIQADDSDISKLSDMFQSSKIHRETDKNHSDSQDLHADIWQEEGHFLLIPLLLFAALWARKGWIAAFLPFAIVFILPIAQPAHAASIGSYSIDSKHLWSSPDQKAMKAFDAGDNESAAKQFTNDEWKASALYRNGDFEASAEALKNTKSSDGLYNRGNALARLGKYQEALDAYDQALEINAHDEDVSFNREQVNNVLQQQQQDQQDSSADGEQSDDNKSEQDNSEQENSQQKSDGEQQQEEQSEQQSADQSSEQNSEDQSAEKQTPSSDSEKQKQSEEELKQRDAEAESQQQKEDSQQYQQSQDDQKQKENDEQNTKDKENEVENKDSTDKPAEIEVNPMEASITEQEKATAQWLKRIPDDPGGLLRRKFLYQYKQIPNQNDDQEPW